MWQEAVKKWLNENERSYAWLARTARLDQSWISMILTGKRNPGPRTLRKLERAMDMPPETLTLTPELPGLDAREVVA
jgi:transcriptional regulator with XRE-family HTH domain